jgi:intracellular sulfur oxidation DsrE/DsrF family protein
MKIPFFRAAIVALSAILATSAAMAAKPQAHAGAKPKPHASVKPPASKPHRVVIQVNQNDPAVMNLALNNASNIIDYYRSKKQDVSVDIVTYGPGLHMLRADTSPVKDRLARLKDAAFPSTVQFSACNNTKQNMEKSEGHPIEVVKEASIVPSGVVHAMELQEKGWSYIRP